MTTLIRTIDTENGKLYTISNGRRLPLADCTVKIQIYESRTNIPVLGKGSGVKKLYASLFVCGDIEGVREITAEFLKTVSRFEATADILRQDGIFERVYFDNIQPTEINLDGEWEFEISDIETVKKFM